MQPRVQLIDAALVEATARRAQASPRRRANHNLHASATDNPHRFLNVFLAGSYVAPHRHLDPPKSETFLVLEGMMALFCFDDGGAVTAAWLLGPAPPPPGSGAPAYGGFGLDVAAGVWHTVTALTPRAVCFEVKVAGKTAHIRAVALDGHVIEEVDLR